MNSYVVTEEITIEADSPIEAAVMARRYKRDRRNKDSLFSVRHQDGTVFNAVVGTMRAEVTSVVQTSTPAAEQGGITLPADADTLRLLFFALSNSLDGVDIEDEDFDRLYKLKSRIQGEKELRFPMEDVVF